jgi:hypothetical protein
MIAPAPSQMPDALAAVTTPSFLKVGLSFDIFSRVVSGRGCSSVSTIFAPFFDWISIGSISRSKTPFFFAFAQVC